MKLFNKIAWTVVFVMLILFGSSASISMLGIYRFATAQLSSNAQDTATALGLNLSDAMRNNDTVLLSRIIDAVFDRGFFLEIRVNDVSGDTVYIRQTKVLNDALPNWFVSKFSILPPEEKALIKNGWNNAGQVFVTSHPRYANLELWDVSRHIVLLFTVVTLFCLTTLMFCLRIILAPLAHIVNHAEKLSKREFPILKEIPTTLEFKVVVESINSMSIQLSRMFAELMEYNDRLRQESYKDTVTGLGNRKYYQQQIDYLTHSHNTDIFIGILVMIRLHNFKDYREKFGYEAADHLLKILSDEIEKLWSSLSPSGLTYIGEGDFIVILQNTSNKDIKRQSQLFLEYASKVYEKEIAFDYVPCNIGIVYFTKENSAKDIFDKAQIALKASIAQGSNSIFFDHNPKEYDFLIGLNWFDLVEKAIEEQRVVTETQAVYIFSETHSNMFHYEHYIRINYHDKILPAGLFVPSAIIHHQINELDRLVVDLVTKPLLTVEPNDNVCINLSVQSIKDREFVASFIERLHALGFSSKYVMIEIQESDIHENLTVINGFLNAIKKYPIKVGIDHFGSGFSSFGYLDSLNIDYIKIDGSYIHNIHKIPEHKRIVQSFIDIAHGLNLKVFATHVEKYEELEVLQNINIDGAQGVVFGVCGSLNKV